MLFAIRYSVEDKFEQARFIWYFYVQNLVQYLNILFFAKTLRQAQCDIVILYFISNCLF